MAQDFREVARSRERILRKEYIFRLNKVQDYIGSHLGEELTLQRLAEVANFSPYHFQNSARRGA